MNTGINSLKALLERISDLRWGKVIVWRMVAVVGWLGVSLSLAAAIGVKSHSGKLISLPIAWFMWATIPLITLFCLGSLVWLLVQLVTDDD